MYLALLGALLLAGKLAEFGPMADLSWWVVLGPFAGAILWWHFADTTGWTQRRQMGRLEQRTQQRRERAMAALGLDIAKHKRASATRADAVRRRATGDETDSPATAAADAASKRRSGDPTL